MGMKTSRLFVSHIIMAILPPTKFFKIKRWLLRWSGANVAKGVRIVSTARFYLTGDLTIGENTWIGHEALFIGGKSTIVIGPNVDIAPRVTLVTGSHELNLNSTRAAGKGYSLPITVERGVWIGASSTILGGVKICESSAIGAGSLVNKDVPARTVYGGVPARSISLEQEAAS